MRRAAAAIAAALALSAPLHAQPLEPVTLASPAIGFPFVAAYVADGLGLWEKHGLKVRTTVIAGIGSTNATSRSPKSRSAPMPRRASTPRRRSTSARRC
jgi:ABC-type nitrate/sulfonate/bicarbonate transport system substrate-binding protein